MIRTGASERGSGQVPALVGVAMVLSLLLLAAQTLVWLHHASVVSAVAYDAARRVATSEDPASATAATTSWARGLLGRSGAAAEVAWSGLDGDVVGVRIAVPAPRLLPRQAAAQLGVDRITREARVRREAAP